MDVIRVAERRQTFDMIQWDGSQDAAEWVTEHFGESATITGDGDDLTLKMWTTWEIPRGDYLMDRWGGFHYVPAAQLDEQFEPAAGSVLP